MTAAVLIQLGASLVAVLFIAWLVGRMGLGADPRIADDAHAIRLADEAEAGFSGVEVARDRAGFAAIVRNAGGRMLLIRAHGNHFAARPVDARVEGRLDKDFLTLTMPERTFGAVTLHLGKEAGVWAARMRNVSGHPISSSQRKLGPLAMARKDDSGPCLRRGDGMRANGAPASPRDGAEIRG